MSKTRVAIIGGGVTGSLVAARLAEAGYSVVLAEKALPGHGSSRRSAASIRAQFGVQETVVGMMYSVWYYSQFHDLMKTPGDPEPVLRKNGYLFLYEDPVSAPPAWNCRVREAAASAWALAQAQVAMQTQVGLNVELLSPTEISERWPHLAAEALVGGTWCPDDGFLDARPIYMRGIEHAQQLGATVQTASEVLGASLRQGRIVAIETSAGRIEADWYVNATNAWAPRLAPLLGSMALPVAPMKRYLYMMEPRDLLLDGIEWDTLPMTAFGAGPHRGAFARPVFGRDDGARLQAGRAHDTNPDPLFSDEDQDRVEAGFGHQDGPNSYGESVIQHIRYFAPQLADTLRIVGTECGYYGVTPDQTPLIGIDPMQANLVHAVGCSGHGLMHAPFTAFLVQAVIEGAGRGAVSLPSPFSHQSVCLERFAPDRSFGAVEPMIL